MSDDYMAGRTYDQISTHCGIGRHYGRCQDESGLHMLQAGQVCMCRCHDTTELADAGCYEDSTFIDGVCVAFGLMGMAEAIRARPANLVHVGSLQFGPACSAVSDRLTNVWANVTCPLCLEERAR